MQEPLAAAGNGDFYEDEDVLITRQSPVLDVRTTGSRRITIGKPASFIVSIANSGPVTADQATITIDLPEWTDVVGTKPSVGTTGWLAPNGSAKQFRWMVGKIAPQGHEELKLEVVPHKSRPFDLAVKWDYKPPISQTVIEVEEPKIELQLDGPREILFGVSEVYRLELFNSGNGDAENVTVSLMPLKSGNELPATHQVGIVPAGKRKVVEVDLVAHQTGSLSVQFDVRGDGLAETKLVEQIVVIRPSLKIEIEAPPVQYVNAVATYRIRVTNPGTAPAENVNVSAAIPTGARHETSQPSGEFQSNSNEILWTLDSLAPSAEKVFTLDCALEQPGTPLLTVHATADGDVTAAADAATLVETIPDLVLDVKDPVGPVRVGTTTMYQINVRNRGTQTAEGVEVVAFFSYDIEPVAAEGAPHQLATGRVLFDKIDTLGIGEDLTLKIHAKAEMAGNHIFRVVVYCKASGIRLISEEMTHFYGGPSSPQSDTQSNLNASGTGYQPALRQ